MNLRNIVSMEVVKDKNVYVFLVPMGVSYEEAHAVAQEFSAGVLELQRLNVEAAEKAKAEEAAKEAVPAEAVPAESAPVEVLEPEVMGV